MRQPVLTAEEVAAFVDEVFPQMAGVFQVVSVAPMSAVVRREIGESDLRPGGTVSGPTIFALADCAFYCGIMAMVGRQALTGTSNLNIKFLRKPPAAALRADARILKLGRRLVTGDVTIHSEGVDAPTAHATVTYAIPPTDA